MAAKRINPIVYVQKRCMSGPALPNSYESFEAMITQKFAANPVKISVMGPPGVGKSTFTRLLAPYLNAPVLCTGDIIRQEIRLKTVLGNQMRKISESGHLLPDELLSDIVVAETKDWDWDKEGLILDGFPRNKKQAQLLQKQGHDVDAVINFIMPEDVCSDLIKGRLVCIKCTESYNTMHVQKEDLGINLTPLEPRVAGICDRCDNVLEMRTDDSPEACSRRRRIWNKSTEPLISYYDKLGLVTHWEVKHGIYDIKYILDQLHADLAKRNFWENRTPIAK